MLLQHYTRIGRNDDIAPGSCTVKFFKQLFFTTSFFGAGKSLLSLSFFFTTLLFIQRDFSLNLQFLQPYFYGIYVIFFGKTIKKAWGDVIVAAQNSIHHNAIVKFAKASLLPLGTRDLIPPQRMPG